MERVLDGFELLRERTIARGLAALDRARAIVTELAASHPEVLDYRRLLSWCDNDTGLLLLEEGRSSEALEVFRRSGRTKQEIADAYPKVVEFQCDLAIAFKNIALILGQSGHPADALAAVDRARAIRQKLADDNPASPGSRAIWLGLRVSATPGVSPAGQRRHWRRLRAARSSEVGRRQPHVTDFQADLSIPISRAGPSDSRSAGRGQVVIRARLAILEACAEADLTSPERTDWWSIRQMDRDTEFAGRTAEAVASYRQALESGRGDPTTRDVYYLACTTPCWHGPQARSGMAAADGPAELDRAMEWLRRAVAAGYGSFDRMQRDPDLDPLRLPPGLPILPDGPGLAGRPVLEGHRCRPLMAFWPTARPYR